MLFFYIYFSYRIIAKWHPFRGILRSRNEPPSTKWKLQGSPDNMHDTHTLRQVEESSQQHVLLPPTSKNRVCINIYCDTPSLRRVTRKKKNQVCSPGSHEHFRKETSLSLTLLLYSTTYFLLCASSRKGGVRRVCLS